MHKDDEIWLHNQLNLIEDLSRRKYALEAYNKVFSVAYDEEPIEHKKMNRARFESNQRLRVYIKKVIGR